MSLSLRTRRRRKVRRGDWVEGWWSGARRVVSPNVGVRPEGAAVDLAVVHSISLPPGRYGGPFIEQFFTNRLDPSAHPYFQTLVGVEVSAHFVIRRDGRVLQFAPVQARAWHAGRSHWRGRDNCNDFSLGIELEGLEGEPFAAVQYRVLARLLKSARRVWPIRQAVGHEHVAPGRKNDPGSAFDWCRLSRRLRRRGWVTGE